jgi:cytochrome c oxidase cbb3-type subunit 3
MGSRHDSSSSIVNTSHVIGGVIQIGLLVFSAVMAFSQEDPESVNATLGSRGERLIIARCAVCHSADLITQQRLSRTRWEATIEKMKHWGAEISDQEADLLIRYLSARYHPNAPANVPPLSHEIGKSEPLKQEPQAQRPVIGVAARGAGVFEHNCQACHGGGAMGGMGPRLAKNPILKLDVLFRETVLYGRGPMPAWSSVLSEQDIADVHEWLLTR